MLALIPIEIIDKVEYKQGTFFLKDGLSYTKEEIEIFQKFKKYVDENNNRNSIFEYEE